MPPRSRILTRLEPGGPAPLAEILAARLGDPLWMLARQWQFGELLAENAGSVIAADLTLTIHPLTHLAPDTPTANWPTDLDNDRLDPRVPLDAAVEAVPPSDPWPLWRRADGGRVLAALTADNNAAEVLAAALEEFPLQPPTADDPEAAILTTLLTGLPDAAALHAVLEGIDLDDPDTPLPPPFDAITDEASARNVLAAWRVWVDTTTPLVSPAAAWEPQALTHRFAVAAASSEGTTVFHGDHPGGPLDWHRFTIGRTGAGLPNAPNPSRPRLRLTPTLLRFPGMPTERWWQVDDHVVDLGDIDAGAADLARMLVLDYALSYGGDAYTVPVRLPTASWTVVERLDVVDAFGDRQTLPAAATADWAMFTVGDPPGLLLVPASVGRLDSDPVDEITLARDELANLAWLIEDRWEGGTGQPIERPSPTLQPPAAPNDPTIDLVWRLVDDPPPGWLPFLPSKDPQLGPTLAKITLTGRTEKSLLAQELPDTLSDRLIPHQGRRLQRRYHLAHNAQGDPVVWAARAVDVARISGASGLKWDSAQLHMPDA